MVGCVPRFAPPLSLSLWFIEMFEFWFGNDSYRYRYRYRYRLSKCSCFGLVTIIIVIDIIIVRRLFLRLSCRNISSCIDPNQWTRWSCYDNYPLNGDIGVTLDTIMQYGAGPTTVQLVDYR